MKRHTTPFIFIYALTIVGCSSTTHLKVDDSNEINTINHQIESRSVTIRQIDGIVVEATDVKIAQSSVFYKKTDGSVEEISLKRVARIEWQSRLDGAKKGSIYMLIVGTCTDLVVGLYAVMVTTAYDEDLDGAKMLKSMTGLTLVLGAYGFAVGGLIGMKHIVEINY